ncbi:MAG: hypothetical protein GBAus27B_000211 [Mycoplasmataceae bacterium]|nr:MAG: hypothetical protein GBAus27B_000211 [Mycoplasmataceae bacterium]
MNKKIKSAKQRECEYQLPNICQQKADLQIIFHLGSVNIAKYWACYNCKEIVEKLRNQQK